VFFFASADAVRTPRLRLLSNVWKKESETVEFGFRFVLPASNAWKSRLIRVYS
jgi:hypothetical protein